MKRMLVFLLAFLTGLLPGFFLVFNFMFSDVSSQYERVLSFLLVFVVYLVLGAAFGLARHDNSWKLGICISLPAMIFALLYSVNETGTIVINLLYAAAAIGASITGASLGAKLSKKRKQ
jgi:chromate transport protein ChrA